MDREPVVVEESGLDWETWATRADVSERGRVFWKTLVSGDVTRSGELTMGLAKLPAGEVFGRHRHQQAEVYLVLEGEGWMEVGAEARAVQAGSAVFIPGDVLHYCENTGTSDLRLVYVFPADSFEEIEYVFE